MHYRFKFILILILTFYHFEKCFSENDCNGCDHSPEWIQLKYLNWSFKRSPISAPLITSASFNDPIPGAIGQPGTRVLIGNEKQNTKWHHGFQICTGTCLNNVKLEASYFLLPKTSKKKSLNTSGQPGSPNFAVPIFDVTGFWGLNAIPGETVFILPGPLFDKPGFDGHFKLKITNLLQGAEFNSYSFLSNCNSCTFELLVGLRWIEFKENLIFKALTGTVPNFPFGPGFYNFKDDFKATNHFFSPQIGFRALYKYSNWFLGVMMKGACGLMNNTIDIRGSSHTLGGNLFFETKGGINRLKGGVFAQPTNIGKHTRNSFAAAFETNLQAGYQITNCLDVFIEYNYLLLSHVAYPGDQINRKINPTLTGLAEVSRATVGTSTGPIPFGEPGPAEAPQGPKEPRFRLKTRNFWAQGITAGIQLHF